MGPGCASNNARGLCSVSPVSCRKSDSAYIPEQKRPQLQREQPAVADKAGKEKLAKAERCHSEHESWGSSGWRRTPTDRSAKIREKQKNHSAAALKQTTIRKSELGLRLQLQHSLGQLRIRHGSSCG